MATITEVGKDTNNTEKNVRLLTRFINLTVYIFDYQHIKTYTNKTNRFLRMTKTLTIFNT